MQPLVEESKATDSRTGELVSRLGSLPLEEVPCYLCGHDEGKLLVDDPPFKVLLCGSCGLGYTSPRLIGDRIHEIYGDEYWNSDSAKDYGYSSYEEDVSGYLRTFELRADLISPHKASGRLLEVGSAAGFFLSVMDKRGYEVHGLEISTEIAESSRKRFGLENIRSCLLEDAGYDPGTFDLVTMWDVVEHMADPIVELRRLRDLLVDDGVLVLQTQDVSSFTRKLLGRRWHHFKQLEHIYHFNPPTIEILLQRSGFEVVKSTRRRAGKFVSFNFLAERSRRLGRIPGIIFSPLRLLGRRFLYVNPYDEMIVVARKAELPDGD